MSKTIYVAADHGGYDLKNQIVNHLSDNYSVEDLGPDKLQLDDDYPDYVLKLVESMRSNDNSVGVLACRSAEGVSIAANRNDWIRAAVVTEIDQAIKAREHNDANVICLSGDLVAPERNIKLLEAFLVTEFSDEPRHKRRIEKIEKYFPL
jgi:ribose 5-phosphate isomerase B